MTDGNRDRKAGEIRELDYQTQPAGSERHRDELRLYAYQLTGSLRDRLYASLTTRTLDVLSGCSHSSLPAQMQPPAVPGQRDEPPPQGPIWPDPFPDELHPDGPDDGLSPYEVRESVSLPFVAALQCLPPRRRAVLLLRAVRGWPTAPFAGLLNVPAHDVEQDLQRAEAAMAASYRVKCGAAAARR